MKTIQLTIDAPERAEVLVEYWRREGGAPCDAAAAKAAEGNSRRNHFVKLAAVPSGDAANGRRNLVVHLSPLSIGYDYCFHFDAIGRAPLTGDQIGLIADIIFKSIQTKALELVRTIPKDQTPAEGANYVDDVIKLTEDSLGQQLGFDTIYDGGGVRGESLGRLVARRYLQDPPLRAEIASAVLKLFKQYRTLHFTEQREFFKKLTAALEYVPLRDPERQLGTTRARLTKLGVRGSENSAPPAGDDELLAWLYTNRATVIPRLRADLQKDTTTPGVTDLLTDLEAFAKATTQPKRVVITLEQLNTLKAKLDQIPAATMVTGRVSEDSTLALTQFLAQAPQQTEALRKSWPRPFDDALHALSLAERIQTTLTQLGALSTAQSLIGDTAAWKVFSARVQVQTSLGVGTIEIPPVAPSTSDAFPAYIGLDVGIALAAMPTHSKRFGVAAPIQYFGLSFYFAAIDKNDPVSLGTTSLCRLVSVNVGVDLLRPDYLDDYGVTGLLGDRLFTAGLGFRLTTYVRLSGGAVMFNYKNPAPFVDAGNRFSAAPYASLSLDFDTFGVIAGKYNGH